MHWSLFATNLLAGAVGIADQVAGTGALAAAGPWAGVALALVNVFGHAALSATGNVPAVSK